LGATNRTKLSFVSEVTPGTTPANPVFKELRVTSNSLVNTPERQASNEIRSDRQITDHILLALRSGGEIGFELSYSSFDDLLEAALQNTWTKKAERDNNGTADSVITAVTASSDTYTVVDAAVDFAPGHLVLASGFTNSGNNQLFKAQASTDGDAVIAPASPGLTDESAPPAAAKLKAIGFEGAEDDITATGTGLASTLLDFTTLGIQVGEWHKIGGAAAGNAFATSALNSYARVSAVAQNAITYDILPTGWTTDSATGKSIQVFFGDFLKNGVTQKAFTFELQQQDITSPTYEYYAGIEIAAINFAMSSNGIITGTMTLIGRGAQPAVTSRLSGATDIAAPTTPVMNTSSHIKRVLVGGVPVSSPSYLTQLGLEINNNLEGQNAIGSLGHVGIRNGEIAVGGPVTSYFGDPTFLNMVANDTVTSFNWATSHNDGNKSGYFWDVPRVKLGGSAPISGKNSDRMFDGRYDASRHATLGYTVATTRFPYLPA
jgi:hypothetical protein